MADNVTLPGAGVVVRTKDVGGGVQAQEIILIDPATGTAFAGIVLTNGTGLPVVNLADSAVKGIVAEGQTVNTQPTTIGGRASTALATKTLVTDGQAVQAAFASDGRFLTFPFGAPEDVFEGSASNTDGTSTSVWSAGAAGVKHHLTWVHLVNTSATPVYVEMKDGTTVRDTIYLAATSGKEVPYPTPLMGTAATAWNFDPSAAATTIICTVGGFASKVGGF